MTTAAVLPATNPAATPAEPAALPSPWPASHTLEEVWLLGQPPLSRLLEYVAEAGIAGDRLDRGALTREWLAASEHYQQLEQTEAGLANQGSHRALDPALQPLAAEVLAHPRFQQSFDTLPTRFGMVELDRLIVCQQQVTRNFVESRMATIGPAPDAETVFRVCMPLGDGQAPVQIRKVGTRRYVFRCQSTDLRFLEPVLLRGDQLKDYEACGEVAGVVGLVVGFGSNFLNAVQVGKRVLLNNGYHRACALRALGVTHAPCLIQTATCADELRVSIKSRVADDAKFYFESARPPLLCDFFDPKIRKLLPVRPHTEQIEVSFEIKDYSVAD